MSTIKTPVPVSLFVAALYAPTFSDAAVSELIAEHFGNALLPGPVFDFNFSDYYDAEMGPNLRKAFFMLDRLLDPVELPEWKLRAMALEEQHAREGKRTINLDPGYLEAPKFVLATAKNFTHRIYIGRGVYADVQLYMRDGKFQTNPWTYPDYKLPEHLSFFEQARSKYFEKIRTKENLD